VQTPGDYRWSSFSANALGTPSPVLTPHSIYQQLGTTPETRQQAYRELFRHELDPGLIDLIRKATNGNFALGSNRFSEQIAEVLGRRVTPGKVGRPQKK
jgi:putative transposase